MLNHPSAPIAVPHWHLTALAPTGERVEMLYTGQVDALREAQALTLEAIPVGGGLSVSRDGRSGAMVNVVRSCSGETVAEISVSARCRQLHTEEVSRGAA